jgi:pimeloyl-ACP methyl ester carboxylesterase
MIEPIHPYDSLVDHGSGLYTLDGAWRKSPFRRRMTVIRREDGEFAIHSAIRLRDDDYSRILDPLGRVGLIVVPSSLHGDEARFYAERYPQAKVLVPEPVKEKCAAKLPRVDGTVVEDWPDSWKDVLVPLQIEGTKMGEAIFLHRASRTLIATDLVFHFTHELTGFTRTLMTWNGVVGRLGPSRIFRWFFLKDREALERSLQPVKGWDFERVVMSHGTIVETDGKRRFLEGFA